MIKVEAKCFINFTESRKRFLLSWHCNGSDRCFIFQFHKNVSFQSKKSEIKLYQLCLGNTSKDFAVNNMKKKNRIKWLHVRFFLLIIILLMNCKKTKQKLMLGFIKKSLSNY